MKNNKNIFNSLLKEIPIFFATDDNYVPYLDIAIRSLVENASNKYKYRIHILNTGLKEDNMAKIKTSEKDNVTIQFDDVTPFVEPIKNKLRNIYHFGLATYYRLFIESMYPQYDKVLYLDCDIVVLGDISKLYNVNIGNNLLAGVKEQIIYNNEVFSEYVKKAVGIEPIDYINAGILVMNLKKFREEQVEEQFVYLLSKYNFDVCDPDQAYLNFICRDKIKHLPNGWNKASLPEAVEGPLNIAHYALYKKPWQYSDVINEEYFWEYAKKSPFYEDILNTKNSFDEEKKAKKEQSNIDIVNHARRIIVSDNTFKKKILDRMEESDVFDFLQIPFQNKTTCEV